MMHIQPSSSRSRLRRIPEMKEWGGLRPAVAKAMAGEQGYGRQGGQKDWKKTGEPRILFPPLA